jgi:hypothetical protein
MPDLGFLPGAGRACWECRQPIRRRGTPGRGLATYQNGQVTWARILGHLALADSTAMSLSALALHTNGAFLPQPPARFMLSFSSADGSGGVTPASRLSRWCHPAKTYAGQH